MLEVLLQVMITWMLGLAGYGTYSTWVSAADLVYWVLFPVLRNAILFTYQIREQSCAGSRQNITAVMCCQS